MGLRVRGTVEDVGRSAVDLSLRFRADGWSEGVWAVLVQRLVKPASNNLLGSPSRG